MVREVQRLLSAMGNAGGFVLWVPGPTEPSQLLSALHYLNSSKTEPGWSCKES